MLGEKDRLLNITTHTTEKPFIQTNGIYHNMRSSSTAKVNGEPNQSGMLKSPNPNTKDNVMENLSKVVNKKLRKQINKWTLIITFTSLVLIVIFITVAFLVSKQFLSTSSTASNEISTLCSGQDICNVEVVETVPNVLKFASGSPQHDEISKHWKQLITMAKSNIDIVSYYWTMNGSDVAGGPYDQAKIGEEILNDLIVASQKGVQIRIVQIIPGPGFPQTDTQRLAVYPNIQVRSLNMSQLVGAGILHTKAMMTDQKNTFVGSANFDWRSLTEVKELGVVMYNCTCAAQDLKKIFEVNWVLAQPNSKIPSPWPEQYQTNTGKDSPMTIQIANNSPARIYWSTSPPEFCAGKRTTDLAAILDVIKKAQTFVYIAVMDYYAAIVYIKPRQFWPVIDAALREAVFDRGINVKLLTSNWTSTSPQQVAFLKSLNEFGKMPNISGSLQVKQFTMPSSTIPYARVNHNKYMVTDNTGFISTSNWSGDYFISTGGISLIINQTEPTNKQTNRTIQEQLRQVFLRDWNSVYAVDLAS